MHIFYLSHKFHSSFQKLSTKKYVFLQRKTCRLHLAWQIFYAHRRIIMYPSYVCVCQWEEHFWVQRIISMAHNDVNGGLLTRLCSFSWTQRRSEECKQWERRRVATQTVVKHDGLVFIAQMHIMYIKLSFHCKTVCFSCFRGARVASFKF